MQVAAVRLASMSFMVSSVYLVGSHVRCFCIVQTIFQFAIPGKGAVAALRKMIV